MYTAPTSTWCAQLKVWLKKKKVSYVELDTYESETARDELLEHTGQLAVPVIVVDGKYIVGFHDHKLEEALKKGK